MKIQSYANLYSPNFSSRNKEIRKADDIMRNAKNAFPMRSSTYADTYYKTLKDGQNSEA